MDSEVTCTVERATFTAMLGESQEAHRKWIAVLVNQHPHIANQLWRHHQRFCEQQARLAMLPLLLVLDPTLPLEGIVREYSVWVDAVADNPVWSTHVEPVIDESNARERAARTKRRRTREALITATIGLVKKGQRFSVQDVCNEARVGLPTLYNHFNSKEELLSFAYNRLFDLIGGFTP
jgi:hypothetical protein